MKEIQVFKNELFGEIRTLTNERGEPLFVGKDVATALGYSNTRDAMRKHVDTEDKTTVAICDTGSNYKSQAVVINESGLYSLILSSKLPTAKAFKRWVTAEVLPQIRKTGGYIPTHDAEGLHLTEQRHFAFYSLMGERKHRAYMVWTPEGVKFLNEQLRIKSSWQAKRQSRAKS